MGERGQQQGLTLIELLVVITLLGFVAATVTVRVGGQLGRAALGNAVALWEFTDGEFRGQARRKGRTLALGLEVGSNRLECHSDADDDAARTVRTLGRGVRLARFVSATREVTNGPVTINYTGHGTSETYAIELATTHERRWIIVAGVTGQATEIESGEDIKPLLDNLLPSGLHAG